jgi:hypothetical protein
MVMAQQQANQAGLGAAALIVAHQAALAHRVRVTLAALVALAVLYLSVVAVAALVQLVKRLRRKSAVLVARVWRPLFQAHPLHTQAAAGVPTLLALAGQPQAAQVAAVLVARMAPA